MSPGKLRFSGAGTAGSLRRRAGVSACVPPPYRVSCPVVFCLFPARSLYRLHSDWKSVHTSSGRCVLHNFSQRQDKKTRISFVIQCDEKESFSNEIRDFMKGILHCNHAGKCKGCRKKTERARRCQNIYSGAGIRNFRIFSVLPKLRKRPAHGNHKKTQCKKYFLIPTKSDHVEPQEEFLRQHLYVCTVENLPTFFFCVMQSKCGRFAVCHFVSGCKNSHLANGRIFPAAFRRCKTLKQRIHRAACNHVAVTPKLCKIFTGGSV